MGHAALELNKKKRSADPVRDRSMARKERQLRAEISSSAGLNSKSSDPITLLTKSYKQTFDAVGRSRASEMTGGSKSHEKAEKDGSEVQKKGDPETNYSEIGVRRRRRDFGAYRHSRRRLEERSFCEQFSDTAFRGGRLAGAVLSGEARNMFISCVARTQNSPGPQNEKQRGIIGDTAIEKDIESQPAKVIFNRDVRSAVGIAVDAIHGADRVLEIFRSFVKGSDELQDNHLEKRNVQTMKQIYPFLDTRGDKALIERYSEKIKQLEGDGSPRTIAERKSLESALNKAQSVLDRKQAEQRRFLTQLELMQSRAREAEQLFTSESFVDTVIEESEALSEASPPDDNDNNDNNKNGKPRRRRSLNDIFNRLTRTEAADEAGGTKLTE